MPVNSGLAEASNALLLSTVVIYALAMLAYACDFAFGRRPPRPKRSGCLSWSARWLGLPRLAPALSRLPLVRV